MHDPQFVPAFNAAPISATLDIPCSTIARRIVSNPTAKHAQTGVSATAPLPASTASRAPSATGPARNAATDGNARSPTAKYRHASNRPPRNAANRHTPRDASAISSTSAPSAPPAPIIAPANPATSPGNASIPDKSNACPVANGTRDHTAPAGTIASECSNNPRQAVATAATTTGVAFSSGCPDTGSHAPPTSRATGPADANPSPQCIGTNTSPRRSPASSVARNTADPCAVASRTSPPLPHPQRLRVERMQRRQRLRNMLHQPRH